jgi:hypothetical protein
MGHRCKARDHFPSESALPRSLDNRKEQVQKILSLAEIRIGGGREWDIAVNNDGFYSRVLRHGSLGLGEFYVDGWWDCPRWISFFRESSAPSWTKTRPGIGGWPCNGRDSLDCIPGILLQL